MSDTEPTADGRRVRRARKLLLVELRIIQSILQSARWSVPLNELLESLNGEIPKIEGMGSDFIPGNAEWELVSKVQWRMDEALYEWTIEVGRLLERRHQARAILESTRIDTVDEAIAIYFDQLGEDAPQPERTGSYLDTEHDRWVLVMSGGRPLAHVYWSIDSPVPLVVYGLDED
jgi:hypothetical protein